MSVYVDDMRAPFGRMIMCHMIADTHAELIMMADRIKVQQKWIQSRGNHGEHFDISLAKKVLAIRYGAIEIGIRELSQKCSDRRGDEGHASYFINEE